MAKGIREFNDRGFRDFDRGFRDFDRFRGFPGFFPGFEEPFFPEVPFGYPGLFPEVEPFPEFFGGFPDFDRFGFRDFDRFGGFRGGDRDFGGFRGGGGDFHGGGGGHGGRAFAARDLMVGAGRREGLGRTSFGEDRRPGGFRGFDPDDRFRGRGDFDRFRGFPGFPGIGGDDICLIQPELCEGIGFPGFPGRPDFDRFRGRPDFDRFRGGRPDFRGGMRRAFAATSGSVRQTPVMGAARMSAPMAMGGMMRGNSGMTLHPAGQLSHGMMGAPSRGMPGGIDGGNVGHPGDKGDMGGRFHDLGEGDDGFRHFDVDGRRGHIDFDGRFVFDDDDFVQPITFDVDNDFVLEERCLQDPIFAETHPVQCAPFIQIGGIRTIAGTPVRAFATTAGDHLGGSVGAGSRSEGFHPADPGQGGIGHADSGRPGGDFRGGIDRGHDLIGLHPERFRVFGDRIFDLTLGDFLPFGYYEYQLILAQNPLLLCTYFPELCGPPRAPPFLVQGPAFPASLSFDDAEKRRRHQLKEQRLAMMMQQQAMLPPGVTGSPGIAGQPGAPGLIPNVSTSSTPQLLSAPPVMNQLATTSTGAVLPVLPDAPMNPILQDPAMLMQTAQLAGAYPAVAGDSGYQYANTDVYANIPNDRRGNILGQPGGPMTGRHNISIANYF